MKRARVRDTNTRKRVTFRKFIEAMEQNGYEQAHSVMMLYNQPGTYPIGAACAIGQAGLNLGINPDDLADSLYRITRRHSPYFGETLSSFIMRRNDGDRAPLTEIANELRTLFPQFLNSRVSGRVMEVETLDT